MHPDLYRLFDLLTDYAVVVGGGAAISYELAKDVDVFFLHGTEWRDAVHRFSAREWQWVKGWGRGVHVASLRLSGVAKLVEFIWVEACDTGQACANRADISTHQAVRLPDGSIVTGPNWTPVTVAPRILHSAHEQATQERLDELTVRYAPWCGMKDYGFSL